MIVTFLNKIRIIIITTLITKVMKIVNGTSYSDGTSDKLIEVLETCRINKTRIVLDYGNTETKQSWGETNDIVGRIGRSTGINKVPLLIHNKRSLGGGEISTDRILSVKTSIGKILLYSL